MESFEVSFELTETDYINYTKFVYFSKIDPSIVDAFKRYKRFVLVMYLCVSLIIIGLNGADPLSFLLIGILVLLALFLNYEKVYWNSMRRALVKNYKKPYFQAANAKLKNRKVQVSGETITLTREEMTLRKDLSTVIKLSVDDEYVYIIYDTYEGFLVPLHVLTEEQKEWFISHQK